METTTLRDPDTTARTGRDGRSIEFMWDLCEGAGDRGTTVKQAALFCGHRKAGMSYFSGRRHGSEFFAVLRNQEKERCEATGLTSTSFMLFDGISIVTQDTARFSQKQLVEFSKHALDALREAYASGDERVTKVFEPDT